jgi:hypothetical protein
LEDRSTARSEVSPRPGPVPARWPHLTPADPS